MRRIYTRHSVLAVVLVVMLLGGSASGIGIILPSVDWTPAALSDGAVDEDHTALDGHLVAYEYGDQIRVTNLAAGLTRTIPALGGVQSYPDVSGDRVVYQDNAAGNWDIKMYQWSTNTSFNVRATAADERMPKIDGNFVIWWDDTNDDLWGRNYDMGGYTAVQLTDAHNDILYDVDNGRAALVIYGNHLYMRELGPLKDWVSLQLFADTIEEIEMHGSRIAVGTTDATDFDVVIYDIADRTLSDVATSDTLRERNPSIFHTGVAWREYEDAVIGTDIGYGFPGINIVQTPGFGMTLFDRVGEQLE